MQARWFCVVMYLSTVAIAVDAAAQEDAEQIIEHRIAGFRDIGTSFRNMANELNASRPSLPSVQAAAQVINGYSKHIPEWFVPGSEPPPRVSRGWLETIRDWLFSPNTLAATDETESHAKPEIWTRRAQFDQAYRRFKSESDAMVRAAHGTDVAAMNAQLRKLEQTCKACHDVFREESA